VFNHIFCKGNVPELALGFNASAPWIGDKNNIRAKTGGVDKHHPQGPVCHVNGKTVPTFICCSENGSVTSELLVKLLWYIDNIGVFDQSDGVNPFLLLDGHGSRFELQRGEWHIMESMCGCAVRLKQVTGKLVSQVNRMAVLK
jgi:hypothetical protein